MASRYLSSDLRLIGLSGLKRLFSKNLMVIGVFNVISPLWEKELIVVSISLSSSHVSFR
jgi:hypothetical protein